MPAGTDVATWILALLALLAAVQWAVLHLLGAISLTRAQRFPSAPPLAATGVTNEPAVTVTIAARNEAETLPATVRDLLGQRYDGPLRIVVVDDGSSDGTADAVRAQGQPEGREVQVLRAPEPPTGWLGKVAALALGASRADGEYVLFTDADVRFGPTVVRCAVDLMQRERLDHLTVLPSFEARGWLLRAVMAAFTVGYLRRLRGRRDAYQGPAPFGFGAFQMVRRQVLQAADPFPTIRMDVLDDLALGAALKRAGAKDGVRFAGQELRVEWYPDLASLIRGYGKNAFGGIAHYRFDAWIGFLVLIPLMTVAPLLPFTGLTPTWTLVAPALVVASLMVEAAVARSRLGVPFAVGLAAPLAHLVMVPAMARSGWLALRSGRVAWRDRSYSLSELRRGRTVNFP